jgi:hypothetical protein
MQGMKKLHRNPALIQMNYFRVRIKHILDRLFPLVMLISDISNNSAGSSTVWEKLTETRCFTGTSFKSTRQSPVEYLHIFVNFRFVHLRLNCNQHNTDMSFFHYFISRPLFLYIFSLLDHPVNSLLSATYSFRIGHIHYTFQIQPNENKLGVLRPPANYTDRGTVACRGS